MYSRLAVACWVIAIQLQPSGYERFRALLGSWIPVNVENEHRQRLRGIVFFLMGISFQQQLVGKEPSKMKFVLLTFARLNAGGLSAIRSIR